MTHRAIECSVTLAPNMEPDQTEYLIYCQLAELGIPVDPIGLNLRHGSLHCVPDLKNPLKRSYFWDGEDLRS